MDFDELMRVLQRDQPRALEQFIREVKLGDQVVIECRSGTVGEFYSMSDERRGLMTALREVPSWLIGLPRSYRFVHNGQQWKLKVCATKKTCVQKRCIFLDVDQRAQPGFSFEEDGDFVPQAKVEEIIHVLNAELPNLRAQLTQEQVNSAQQTIAYKFANEQGGAEPGAPLCLAYREKEDPNGRLLKTRLTSVASELVHKTIPFDFDKQVWFYKFSERMRVHINPLKHRIVFGTGNTGGFTRGISAESINQLCSAFNSKTVAEHLSAAQEYSLAATKFKEQHFSTGSSLRACWLQKQQLRVKLLEAPQWLMHCKETFYLPVGEEVWELSWADKPRIDLKTYRIWLGIGKFNTEMSSSELETLMECAANSLSSWQEALGAQLNLNEKRLEEFTKHGAIKRQRILLEDAVEALVELKPH